MFKVLVCLLASACAAEQPLLVDVSPGAADLLPGLEVAVAFWQARGFDVEIGAGVLVGWRVLEPGELGTYNGAISISPEITWWDGDGECADAFHLGSVVTHELGHALGLGHSTDPDSVMAPALGPCEVKPPAASPSPPAPAPR